MLRTKMMIAETFLLYSGYVIFWMALWKSEIIRSSLEGRDEFLEMFKSEVNGSEFSR